MRSIPAQLTRRNHAICSALFALLVCACSVSVPTVYRAEEYSYKVEVGRVTWIVEADTLALIDPRRRGVGQFRLRRALIDDEDIITCGQCNVVEALSSDGVESAWAGGGHGLESDQIIAGVWPAAEVGETLYAEQIRFTSLTVLYSVEGHPLRAEHVRITIDESGFLHEQQSIALQDHSGHLRYEDMLSTAPGAEFRGWRVVDERGVVVETGAGNCGGANDAVGWGTRLEFIGPRYVASVEDLDGRDWPWLVQRRESCQWKGYHVAEDRSDARLIRAGDAVETRALMRIE